MTVPTNPTPTSTEEPNRARRDLIILVVAVLAFVSFSAGALVLIGRPSTVRDPLKGASLPTGQHPLALTLVHTNDSWGYLDGCG